MRRFLAAILIGGLLNARGGDAAAQVRVQALDSPLGAAHMAYALHHHFVFITKSRKPMLRGEIGTPAARRIVAIPQVNGLHHRYERRAT